MSDIFAAQGRCRDHAGVIGDLPQIDHQRAQGGVAGILPKLIRVPIAERMSQAFYRHAVVSVLRFRRLPTGKIPVASCPHAASAPVCSSAIDLIGSRSRDRRGCVVLTCSFAVFVWGICALTRSAGEARDGGLFRLVAVFRPRSRACGSGCFPAAGARADHRAGQQGRQL